MQGAHWALMASLAVSAVGGVSAGERTVVRADGRWEMAQATAPDRWMPAVVPGTVLSTLVANGVVPDPMFGVNNRREDAKIPDLANHREFYTASFRTKVLLPAEFGGKTVWMRPEGVNYRSEIYLNGRLAASPRGMFARNPVDVTAFVKPGATNDVFVKVWPVDHPGVPMPKGWGAANGEWHNGGDGEIGRNVTMLMTAGWDFTFADGIRDRNTGIWRDLTFFATGGVRLDAPYVRTALAPDRGSTELTLEIDLHNARTGWNPEAKGRIVAEVEGTDVRFERAVALYRGERRTEFLHATLPSPRLWWPRNKGPQNLYTLRARFVEDGGSAPSDAVSVRFGVRDIASDATGRDGARQFRVNGRPVFIRGTNWIPDAMLKADDARLAHELRLLAESGVNLVRLWGGGIVESDRFYDLCDEYGLLVWQEFWMTGDTRHPDDPALYLDNVAQQVRRLRAHASLAHWVASNESTEVSGTEELVRRLTGTRSWMRQSECDGVHDGSPYVSVNPMRHYEDTASDRGSRVCGFNPEYGAVALPRAEFLRSFMPDDMLWPVRREVWQYREGGGFNGMTTVHHALVTAYGESRGIDDYCIRSEAADAQQQRAIWECWNRARNTATGVLYWYENAPHPQIVVHGWDYDHVQTPMFFAQKRALEPLHAQYEYLSNAVSACSDVVTNRRVTVTAEVWDFASRKVWERSAAAEVPAESCVDVFTVPATALPNDRPHFVAVRLLDADGYLIGRDLYWRSCGVYEGAKTMTGPCTAGFAGLGDLPAARLETVRVGASGAGERWRVSNVGGCIALLVRLTPQGGFRAGDWLSDNWFSLLPGESREVDVEFGGRAPVANDYPARLKSAVRAGNGGRE